MEIEVVGVEKLDPVASDDGRELLGDGVHRMPETRQSQAIVGVDSPSTSIILQDSHQSKEWLDGIGIRVRIRIYLIEDEAAGFVDDEEAVDGSHLAVYTSGVEELVVKVWGQRLLNWDWVRN